MTLQTQISTLSSETAGLDLEGFRPVSPPACHKALRHNAFITGFRAVGGDRFELLAEIDAEREGFFFDHPIDHVPGMLSACVIRQAALVVFHEGWGASYADKFLLDEVSATFRAFADHDRPILVDAHALDIKRRGQKVSAATVHCALVQDGSCFAEGRATIRALSAAAYARVHGRR